MTELVIVVRDDADRAAIAIPNAIRAWYNMELRATGDRGSQLDAASANPGGEEQFLLHGVLSADRRSADRCI